MFNATDIIHQPTVEKQKEEEKTRKNPETKSWNFIIIIILDYTQANNITKLYRPCVDKATGTEFHVTPHQF